MSAAAATAWPQCSRNCGKSSGSQLLQRVIVGYVVIAGCPSAFHHRAHGERSAWRSDRWMQHCCEHDEKKIFFQATYAHNGRCLCEVQLESCWQAHFIIGQKALILEAAGRKTGTQKAKKLALVLKLLLPRINTGPGNIGTSLEPTHLIGARLRCMLTLILRAPKW